MANLKETAYWEEGIYQWETTDPVLGAVCNWFAKWVLRQKAGYARRKPQQGWTPCEDLQRGRARFMT